MRDWSDAVKETQTQKVPVPKGWLTIEQFGEKIGVQRCQASRLMSQLVASSKVDRQKFRIVTGTRCIPVMHYRLKGSK